MGLFSKKSNDQAQPYQEGDIVAHQDDTFRVRRNDGKQLQLVNNTGYHLADIGSVEDTYYCGHCSAFVAISRGLHPHNG